MQLIFTDQPYQMFLLLLRLLAGSRKGKISYESLLRDATITGTFGITITGATITGTFGKISLWSCDFKQAMLSQI